MPAKYRQFYSALIETVTFVRQQRYQSLDLNRIPKTNKDDCLFQILAAALNTDAISLLTMFTETKRLAPILLEMTPANTCPVVLMPPTNVCLAGCVYKKKGSLTNTSKLLHHVSNPAAKAFLFDVDGKKTDVIRPNMTCFGCNSIYHYDMWFHGRDKKYRFYSTPQEHVSISQDTLFTRPLCELLIQNM
jgi:hypothetical protein